MVTDVGKYYKYPNHATIYISKKIADQLPFQNKDSLIIKLDETTNTITITSLEHICAR